MFSIEPSCPTTAGPEYPSITEAQEKDLKTNYMKIIEVLKEEMDKSFNEIQDKNKQKKMEEINPLNLRQYKKPVEGSK